MQDLEWRVAHATAVEGRAQWNAYLQAHGGQSPPFNYEGLSLTYYAPEMNLCRDPRYSVTPWSCCRRWILVLWPWNLALPCSDGLHCDHLDGQPPSADQPMLLTNPYSDQPILLNNHYF